MVTFTRKSSIFSCSSLNIDGLSKRVVYSESVNKMLQNGIEKSNFSDGPFSVIYILMMGCSSLNTRCVFIKVIYSE